MWLSPGLQRAGRRRAAAGRPRARQWGRRSAPGNPGASRPARRFASPQKAQKEAKTARKPMKTYKNWPKTARKRPLPRRFEAFPRPKTPRRHVHLLVGQLVEELILDLRVRDEVHLPPGAILGGVLRRQHVVLHPHLAKRPLRCHKTSWKKP